RSVAVGGKEKLMDRRGKPKKGKAEAKRPPVPKSTKDAVAKVRDLEKRLAEVLKLKTDALNRETEALEQQTATAEILGVIASSPTDLQPVLEAVAERAARLCGANDAVIYKVHNDVRRQVAHFGSVPITVAAEVPLSAGTVTGRAILERRTIHISDVFEEFARGEYADSQQRQRVITFRTLLVTPLLREGVAVGAITIRRLEVQPFTDKQITLVETFADQAVIAIENVRLFTELEDKNKALTEAHAQ